MRAYSDKEVVFEAEFFLSSNKGVIKTAKLLQMPKSTLHWHLRKRLKELDYGLWIKVKALLMGRGGKK